MFFDNPYVSATANRQNGYVNAKTLLALIIVFCLFVFIRAEGSIGEFLMPAQTKAEAIEINKQLNKDLEKVIAINHDNEAANKAKEEAKELEKIVIEEVKAKKTETAKKTVKKIDNFQKEVAKVNKKATENNLTPEQEAQEFVEIVADSIWDDFCSDNPSNGQCLS